MRRVLLAGVFRLFGICVPFCHQQCSYNFKQEPNDFSFTYGTGTPHNEKLGQLCLPARTLLHFKTASVPCTAPRLSMTHIIHSNNSSASCCSVSKLYYIPLHSPSTSATTIDSGSSTHQRTTAEVQQSRHCNARQSMHTQ